METGEWEQSDPVSQREDHVDQPIPPEDVQKEIDVIERRLQQLRGPCAPPLSVDNVLVLTRKSLPWVWQRDIAQALFGYLKSDPANAAKARRVLAQDTWDVVYHFVDSASSSVRAAARPVRTSLLPQQSSEQIREEGTGAPSTCLKCGMHSHWARHCATQSFQNQPHPPMGPMPARSAGPQRPEGPPAGPTTVGALPF